LWICGFIPDFPLKTTTYLRHTPPRICGFIFLTCGFARGFVAKVSENSFLTYQVPDRLTFIFGFVKPTPQIFFHAQKIPPLVGFIVSSLSVLTESLTYGFHKNNP